MQLVAVPLLELYDNVARWGTIICALPLLLSRLRLSLVGETPLLALPAPQQQQQQQQATPQQPEPAQQQDDDATAAPIGLEQEEG